MHACTYARIAIRTCWRTHTHMLRKYTCNQAGMHTHRHTLTRACACMHKHTRTHTHNDFRCGCELPFSQVYNAWKLPCRMFSLWFFKTCSQSLNLVVVAFHSCTLWVTGTYSCALTNACRRVRGLHLGPFFIIPPRRPSSEDLSPFLESGCCYAKSLAWLKTIST